MTKQAQSRYERDADGRLLIDVAADKIEDLYNDFDRIVPILILFFFVQKRFLEGRASLV